MAKTPSSSSPPASSPNTSARLQELIAERHRYESWIASLEARRDSAPAHVFTRVEEDYRARLARTCDELAERAGELRERIAGLAERFASVQRDETLRRDAKAEAELRATVGEYNEARWKTIAADADREIATLVQQSEAIQRELGEFQAILDQSTGAAPPPAAAAKPAAAPAVAVSPPASATVTGGSNGARSADAPAATSASGSPAAAKVEPAAATRSPRPSELVERVKSTPPGGVFISKTGEVRVRAGEAASATATMAPPETERSDRGSKTLKCTECGTLNYAKEWYCEGCGAELAAL